MRIRNVIQLHTVNRLAAIGWPLIIMSMSLALVIVIGAIAVSVGGADASRGMNVGMQWNGAIFALLGPLIGFGFTAMGQYFPLALGLGLTRREFAIGTALVFLGNALFYATIVTVGKVVEVATGGFGLGVRFFDTHYTGVGPWWQTLVQTSLVILTVCFVGAAITTAFHRWGQSFLWVFWIALGLLVLAFVAGMLLSAGFQAFVGSLGSVEWATWMGVVAVIGAAGAAAWLALVRRAQVR
ncbi:hypothetical protein [Agrococcus sp. HG114]|uniref:hypothetical protein n=1 Tax=Agrococcus sp. HG114 TaxID=2969757 RepID=UPI00215A8D44|nr:hypothetical protein [Agrococcus sp. HG114]MCR8671386.1 hypothetical protein [Agrococcus sp. HG114]